MPPSSVSNVASEADIFPIILPFAVGKSEDGEEKSIFDERLVF